MRKHKPKPKIKGKVTVLADHMECVCGGKSSKFGLSVRHERNCTFYSGGTIRMVGGGRPESNRRKF